MKKAKTFIIPMLALAAFGLVACGGGQSSSQQQSSSEPHASIDVDKIASVEITNKDAMKKDWPINEGSRTLDIKVLNTEGKKLSETVLLATGELKVTTSNAQVADVLGAGVFAKAAGKATITVTCQGKSDTVEVNVVAPKVAQSVAATLQQIANLAQGETFPEAIMTKGVVKEVTSPWDAGYGNISFKIKDADADNELLCYRVVPAEGIDGSKIKAGDEVVINGKIKNYNGTLEYDAGAAIQEWKDGGQQVIVVKNIADVKAGDSVELTGTVAAISKKAFVLTDGTASIYVYTNAVPAIGTGDDKVNLAVGDVIKLTGAGAEYHGFVQIAQAGLAMEKVEGTPATVTPTALTAEGANALKTAAAYTGYKAYSWVSRVQSIDGQLCANVEGSDIKIQVPNSSVEIKAGHVYNITAFFTAYDTKYDYALMVPMVAEEVQGSVYFDKVSAEVELGESGAAVAKTVGVADDTYTWTSSDEAVATVADGVISGVAKGDATITATSVANPENSASFKVTIVDQIPLSATTTYTSKKGTAQDTNTGISDGDHKMTEIGFDQTAGQGKFVSNANTTKTYKEDLYGFKFSTSSVAGKLVLTLNTDISSAEIMLRGYKAKKTAVKVNEETVMLDGTTALNPTLKVTISTPIAKDATITIEPAAKKTKVSEVESDDLRFYVDYISFTQAA